MLANGLFWEYEDFLKVSTKLQIVDRKLSGSPFELCKCLNKGQDLLMLVSLSTSALLSIIGVVISNKVRRFVGN